MATTADDPNSDNGENNRSPNPNADLVPRWDAIVPQPFSPSSPVVCLQKFAVDSLNGAVLGSIFGFGSGLVAKKGFKGSLPDAGSSAKLFAIYSGVHGLVLCILKRLRGMDDVINAGVAGCCTGLAVSFPGPPLDMLKNCVGIGGFSLVMDMLNRRQAALALPLSAGIKSRHSSAHPPLALPLLAFPLPDEFKDAFSVFCKSIRQRGKFSSATR